MEDGLRGFVPLGRERSIRRPVGELQDEDVRVFARARHLVERRICDERLPLHHLVEDLKRHLGESLVVRVALARQGLEIAEVIHMAGPRLSAERCDYREKADEHGKVAAHRALLKGGCRTWTAVQAPSRQGGYPRSGRRQPKSRCPLECRLGLEMNIIRMIGPPCLLRPCSCPAEWADSESNREPTD